MLRDPEPVKGHGRTVAGIEPGRRADRLGGHAGDLGGAFGRPVRDEASEVLPAVDARLDVGRIGQAFFNNHMSNGVEEGDVRTRTKGEVKRGVFGKLDPARVDDDELRALQNLLANARADDGMVLRRVRADDEDRARKLYVVEGIRRRAGAENGLHGSGRRRVADTRAAVDIVGAEHDAREFLDEVVLFVRRPGRAQDADGVGSVRLQNSGELVGAAADGGLPVRWLPASAAPLDGPEHAILGLAEGEGIAPLDAEVAPVYRRVAMRPDLDDAIAFAPDVELAARPAIDAGRTGPFVVRLATRREDVGERARRAGVDAGSAGDAGARGEVRRAAGHDFGLLAAPDGMPDELALNLRADADAAEAVDALGHVDLDDRMGQIAVLLPRGLAARFYAIGAEEGVKLLVGIGGGGLRRDPLGHPVEERLAERFGFVGMGSDPHAPGDARRAGRARMCLTLDLDGAEAAVSRRVEARIVAKGRDGNAESPGGFQNGGIVLDFNGLAVDLDDRHSRPPVRGFASGRGSF